MVVSNIYKTSPHVLINFEKTLSDQNKSMLLFDETLEYAN